MGQSAEQKELAGMEKVLNVESADRQKIAAFQSEALQKWSHVHKIAYGNAKDQLQKMEKVKKAVQGEMLNEHEILLTKDEEIQRLKLALNLATNPQAQHAVHKAESKEQQLEHELKKSATELKGAEDRRQELRHLIAKAEQDHDQHKEITYGAEVQDLVVSIKRGKLHVQALKMALEKARSDVKAADTKAENVQPGTPAAEAVAQATHQSEDKDHKAADEGSAPATIDKSPKLKSLEDQLHAEEEKLAQAKEAEEAKALNKSEEALKKQKASLQAEENKDNKSPQEPLEPQSAPKQPSPSSESEDRAQQAANQAQKLLVVGKQTEKDVNKAAATGEVPTRLGESIQEKRASLLKAELQLKKQQSLLLKVEGDNA